MTTDFKVRTWLWVALATVIVLGGGFTWWQVKGSKQANPTSSPTPTVATSTEKTSPSPTAISTVDWQTYKNDIYGFSFKYPKDWQLQDRANPVSQVKPDFAINYEDPQRDKEIEISNCLSNETVNWTNPSPTKQSCEPILANLTDEQRKTLNTKLSIRNIYVWVFKKTGNLSLNDWLIKTYKISNTELEKYKVGSEITMGGEKGYISAIGCCGGYDVSYVIQGEGYIFQLGTNYPDPTSTSYENNSLLKNIASTFQFTK